MAWDSPGSCESTVVPAHRHLGGSPRAVLVIGAAVSVSAVTRFYLVVEKGHDLVGEPYRNLCAHTNVVPGRDARRTKHASADELMH